MVNIKVISSHECIYCHVPYKSLSGLKRHMNKCKKKPCISSQRKETILNPLEPENTSVDHIIDVDANVKPEAPTNIPYLPNVGIEFADHTTTKSWGNMTYNVFFEKVNSVYNEIVKYRRNLFNVPSGKAGKFFFSELAFWLRQFNSSSQLNGIALKVFMILPSLLLQKPSAKSKSKEHTYILE